MMAASSAPCLGGNSAHRVLVLALRSRSRPAAYRERRAFGLRHDRHCRHAWSVASTTAAGGRAVRPDQDAARIECLVRPDGLIFAPTLATQPGARQA